MRFPWLRRPHEKPAEPPPMQRAEEPAQPPTMPPTVDLTLSRMVFYRAVATEPMSPCPRCGTMLSSQTGLYFVATQQGKRQGDSLMMSGDFGFYCPACPTVVIDPEELGQYLDVSLRRWNVGEAYVVLGLIDVDAIPEAERDVPFDELAALPLVPFQPVDRPRLPHNRQRRQPQSKRKKRR